MCGIVLSCVQVTRKSRVSGRGEAKEASMTMRKTMDEMPVVPVVGNQPNNDMTKAELEKEVERLRKKLNAYAIRLKVQRLKPRNKRSNPRLSSITKTWKKMQGNLMRGLAPWGHYFCWQFRFLLSQPTIARVREKQRRHMTLR